MRDRLGALVVLSMLCCVLAVSPAEGARSGSATCEDRAVGGGEPAWCAAIQPAPADRRTAAEPVLAPGDTAWAWEFFNGGLGSHALNDFPGWSPVGFNLGFLFAIDFDPTATTLYALDSGTMQFGTLNLTDATFTSIGPSAPTQPGQDLWSGMTIHPVTGTIYASAIAGSVDVPYSLYTIDPATGTPTLVGSSATTMAMIDIAIDCNGNMYGHDIIEDAIYEIDPADGSVTLIGPTGVDSNFAQGMDFDNEAGVLYAWTYQGGGANQFGTIDLATGDLTPLSVSNPIGEFEGTVQNVCAASSIIFEDGFESGDTSAWSATVP